jgi:5-methylcytosine-specific restriction endonuclease McrA
MEVIFESLRLLTNEQLLSEMPVLVARERTATTMVVAALSELDSRQLYLARGFPSLYVYCARELKLSEGTAYRRIHAARAIRRFPVAFKYLQDGSLSLTTLTLLAPSLTGSNHMTLLEAARHKTRREVQRQVAALKPHAPDLIPIHMMVSRETEEQLHRAQDLLRHVLPDGDVAAIFARALTVLIADLEKKKLATVKRPRRARLMNMGSRHISAAVRRAVAQRDGGRCAFVGSQGRCTETGFLEYHHVVPYARGGTSTVDNIQLRCRAHNQLEGEVAFGRRPKAVRGREPP